MADLAVRQTAIPGLLVVDLVLHSDPRGWFKENWQRAKMTALGLPDFGPVQHSLAFNTTAGVTRGFHAEPWDKLVSIAHGRIFGAWVDLRPGPNFGAVVTEELGPEKAVFVPRGVANSYQTLVDDTVYSYLVNDHWSPESRASYSYVNLADSELGVSWPIPLADATISDADATHPPLASAVPVPPKRTVIVGAGGQLGRALRKLLPDADGVDLPNFDITDPAAVADYPWSAVSTVINASAYTAVDAAETEEGRRACWRANVDGVGNLVKAALKHRLKLVHISSDYVFDGTVDIHRESETFSPLGVYGQTKAASDALVAQVPSHYLLRTSWVIGDGKNFVRTMAGLCDKGICPTVVDDQFGRLTFTTDLAAAIVHLLGSTAEFGTYNLTNSGNVASWCDIAKEVFRLKGRPAEAVTGISTQAYSEGKLTSPRPRHSTLDLSKIERTGFTPPAWDSRLKEYLAAGDPA
jgi:dTDP-4-dehydrorhamnose 3,5-epimerase/reductase